MEADLPLLVKEQDIGAALEESVGGGETGETASDDDNLSHYNAMYVGGGDGGGEDIGVKVWDERANSLYRCRITGQQVPSSPACDYDPSALAPDPLPPAARPACVSFDPPPCRCG